MKKNFKNHSLSSLKRVSSLALLISCISLVTGCPTPETTADAGPLADAGITAETDAGDSVESDSGTQDAGDSVESDSGTQDAGDSVESDSGTQDAGDSVESDSGTQDAGDSVESDSGTQDAGSTTHTDAGLADAGSTNPCDGLDFGDAGLGSLELHPDYSVVESAAAPAGLSRTAFASNGAGGFYAVGIEGNSVIDLANWPSLVKGGELFNIIAPADENELSFLSPYLSATATHIATGYTVSAAGFPGKVALYNNTDLSTLYVNAPGNYTATLTDNSLFIDGQGANDLLGAAVYRYNLDDNTAFTAAEFSNVDFGGSGYCLATSDVFIAGYSDSNFTNHAPALDLFALQNETNVDVSSGENIFSGGIVDATNFGSSAAFLVGAYDANFALNIEKVTAVDVSIDFDGLLMGPEINVVEVDAAGCTTIDYITSMGEDLVIAARIGSDVQLIRIQTGQ